MHSSAQVIPEVGESIGAYLDRWDAWTGQYSERERSGAHIIAIDRVLSEWCDDDRYWSSMPPRGDADEDELADWEMTVAFIQAHPEVLESVRDYAKLPIVGESLRASSYAFRSLNPRVTLLPVGPAPLTYSDIAPTYWSSMREHSILLRADAYLAIVLGDDDRLLSDLRAIQGIASQCLTTRGWFDRVLVSSFVGSLKSLCLDPDIDWSGIDATTMQTIVRIMDETDRLISPIEALATEKIIAMNTIDWFSEDSDRDRFGTIGIARLIELRFGMFLLHRSGVWSWRDRIGCVFGAIGLRYAQQPIDRQRRFVEDYYSSLIWLCGQSPAKLESLSRPILERRSLSTNHDITMAFAQYVAPMDPIEFNLYYSQVLLNAAQLRMLLEVHHRMFGAYPRSIDELRGELPKSGFRDCFSDHALRFRVINGRPLIYSLGPDRDDDQGRALLGDDGELVRWPEFIPLDDLKAMNDAKRKAIDGDWVLYPPTE